AAAAIAACVLVAAAAPAFAADGAADSLAIADSAATRLAPADTVSILEAFADSAAPRREPRPALFNPYAADEARARGVDGFSAIYRRDEGVRAGSRTPLEPLRDLPHVALERFGYLGQAERFLLMGDENLSLRIAGAPILPSRSGITPYEILPTEVLRLARAAMPADDPFAGARGTAGSLDWSVAPRLDPDEEPVTTAFAERGPFAFRAYRASFDRRLGPLRANIAYQSARNRVFGSENFARARASYLTLATEERLPVPVLLFALGSRQEIDLSLGARDEATGRGTEERSVIVARSAVTLPFAGRTSVLVKDDRVQWRTADAASLRGRDRESGAMFVFGEARAISVGAWGYAGLTVDERAERSRGSERAGGSANVRGAAGRWSWSAYAGGERVSPVPARELLGASAARTFDAARIELAASRAYDHVPRGLLLADSLRAPARKTALTATIATASRADSARARVTLLRRSCDDAIFLDASDPFYGGATRASYAEWGGALNVAAPAVYGITLSGEYLILEDDSDRPLPLRPRHRAKARAERAFALARSGGLLGLFVAAETATERAAFDRINSIPASFDLRAGARLDIAGAIFFMQAENLLDRCNYVLPYGDNDLSLGCAGVALGVLPEGRSYNFGVSWLLRN
ncbi:MAG: hypothetical protein ACKVU1_05075, partial [bacterium]